MRGLQVKDVFTVADMLSKAVKASKSEFAASMRAEGSDPFDVGVNTLISGYPVIKGDLMTWLADLDEKSPEEFEKMPASELITLLDGLIDREDIRSFFGDAGRLARKFIASLTSSKPGTTGPTPSS